MKKIISLLVMSAVVISLSGCLDPQDNSGGKLPSKEVPKVVSHLAL